MKSSRSHLTPNFSAPCGFTLVELIVVLILIGIISSLGIGLFTGPSAFSPLLASQQLSSATLLAQQAALAGSEAGSISIGQTSDSFEFTVGAGTASARVFGISRKGTTLSTSEGNLPLSVAFNALGAPIAGANVQFVFSGESSYSVCLSSLGSVYAGTCQ